MDDEAKQGDEVTGGHARRHRVRVNVARGEADDAVAASRRPRSDAGEADGGNREDVAPDDSPAEQAVAEEELAEEVETLVAQACIEELAKAEAQRDAYLDQLQRLKAEFDNYRKRLQREGEALRLRAAEGLVESLLPVMDNMERALEAAGKHEENKLVDGVELVSEQLRSVLASQGLEEVPAAPGVPFDPTVHEAVMAQESDTYPEGTIAAVLEKGYLLHGRLLRPVKVIVAR